MIADLEKLVIAFLNELDEKVGKLTTKYGSKVAA